MIRKRKMMMKMKSTLGVALFVAALAAPVPARANAIITGILNFTGTAQVSFGNINLGNNISISAVGAQTGGFTALAGTQGTILNITNAVPVETAVSVPNFVTFAANPFISFELTRLFQGTTGFTQPGSPYNLANVAGGSTASFVVAGWEHDSGPNPGASVPVIGIFTTQFIGQTYQQILDIVINQGGTVTASYSATFATQAVPEPGTLFELLAGFGAIGLGVIARRRKSADVS